METIQQLDAHSLMRVITIHTHIEPYTKIIKSLVLGIRLVRTTCGIHVCMVITCSRVWNNQVRLPILLGVSRTGDMEYFPVPVRA